MKLLDLLYICMAIFLVQYASAAPPFATDILKSGGINDSVANDGINNIDSNQNKIKGGSINGNEVGIFPSQTNNNKSSFKKFSHSTKNEPSVFYLKKSTSEPMKDVSNNVEPEPQVVANKNPQEGLEKNLLEGSEKNSPEGKDKIPLDIAEKSSPGDAGKNSIDGVEKSPLDSVKKIPIDGADKSSQSGAGKNPIDGVEKSPLDSVKKILIDGADKSSPSGAGNIPLDGADMSFPDGSENGPPDGAEKSPPDGAEIGSPDGAERGPPDGADKIPLESAGKGRPSDDAGNSLPVDAKKSSNPDDLEKSQSEKISDVDLNFDEKSDTTKLAAGNLGGKPDYKFEGHTIQDDTSSHFFAYLLTLMVLAIIMYLVFHNKKRIIALLIEGRSARGRATRRGSRARYHKLDNNLEEAMSNTKTSSTKLDQIY